MNKPEKRKAKYQKEYAEMMLRYFAIPTGEDPLDRALSRGLPSFIKFAFSIGVTLSDIEDFREKHPAFRKAYNECRARLRDLLFDGMVTKKFDASSVKTILSSLEEEEVADEGECVFPVTLTVLHE